MPAEAWGDAGEEPADGGLAARRAAVAELVRVAREARDAEALAEKLRSFEGGDHGGRSLNVLSRTEQMELLFGDMKTGDGDGSKTSRKNRPEKVKGFRQQDNFGLTRFIKP